MLTLKKYSLRFREQHPFIFRFTRDCRGVTVIIFGLLLVPMLGFAGLAIDYGRALSAQAHLARAIDAAGLAAGVTSDLTEKQVKQRVQDYFKANYDSTQIGHVVSLDVELTDTGHIVKASGSVETTLMAVLGIKDIDVSAITEIMRANTKIELALVLDNTGSMKSRGKINALRDASTRLLNILYGDKSSDPNLKVALVPFVTAVNIKSMDFKWNWIDTAAEAKYHGINFDESGGEVNHLRLFDQIPNTTWKGCVEARAEPYDLDDTPPTSADTRWVPYFWPDEPDRGRGDYDNKYLKDAISGDQKTRQAYAGKYNGRRASIDETPSTTRGPNKSCARPLVPLTSDKNLLLSEVDQMAGWDESGTNIAQGLVWGWRVLSPGEPYTQGVAYDDDETSKVMIMLTDGENRVWGGWDSHNKSNYTSYGYLSNNRLGTQDKNAAIGKVDEKVQEICTAIKGQGIKLYTITFQVDSASTRDLMKRCATSPSMYFDSPSNKALQTTFETIASLLSSLRISR